MAACACALGLAATVLVARRITRTSWPLDGAEIKLVVFAGGAYLASFVFRALGWQRLFPAASRPDRSRCLAACGAAAASGVILPFRLDYLVKVATLRRLGGVRVGLEAIVLSILALGLVDAVAMLPLAVAAFVHLRCGLPRAAHRRRRVLPRLHRGARRSGLGSPGLPLLAAIEPAGGALQIASAEMLLAPDRPPPRVAFCCAAGSCGHWGNTFLLWALGVGFSPAFALVVLCLAAAASILPITAGGAIASIGATSGVLLALGVPIRAAVNYSLASGLLLTSTALVAAIIGVSGSLIFALGRRRLVGIDVR